jgi:ribonuclease HI
VRGHAGHAKNEYANDLATRAASDQSASGGLAASAFPEWLASERTKGRYSRYDPDADLSAS